MNNWLRNFLYLSTSCFVLGFTPLLSIWTDPVDIFATQSVDDPAIALDASGNALVIASISDDLSTFYEKTAKIVQGVVQSTQAFTPIGTNECENVIAVNDQGNGLAAWLEIDNNTSNLGILGTYYNGSTWESPTVLTDAINFNVQGGLFPGINLDNSNKGLVSWIAFNNNTSQYHVQFNRYAGGWSSPQDIYVNPSFLSTQSFSGSSSGKAITAWYNFSPYQLQAATFDGVSWTTTNLSTDVFSTCSPFLDVSMNNSSNAIILWNNQSSAGLSSISYINGSYTAPQIVYSPPVNEDIADAKIVLDDQGNAIALWSAYNFDINKYKLMANRSVGGFWGTPVILEINDNVYFSLNIDADSVGNAYAVWQNFNDSTSAVYYQYFNRNTSAWLNAPVLLSQPQINTTQPFLSMNASGQATVAWAAGDADPIVQAVFSLLIQPPQKLTGKQVKNHFLIQTDIVNILNWTPSLTTSIVKYNIYRDGVLINSTTSSTYQDHHRKKNVSYFYSVTSVNAQGTESDPVTIVLPN
ncbi:MAG: hypothetical protein WC222_10450 [Parachlamydiales bacterium]